MDESCDNIPDIVKEILKFTTDSSIKLNIVEKIQTLVEQNLEQRPVIALFAINLSITTL